MKRSMNELKLQHVTGTSDRNYLPYVDVVNILKLLYKIRLFHIIYEIRNFLKPLLNKQRIIVHIKASLLYRMSMSGKLKFRSKKLTNLPDGDAFNRAGRGCDHTPRPLVILYSCIHGYYYLVECVKKNLSMISGPLPLWLPEYVDNDTSWLGGHWWSYCCLSQKHKIQLKTYFIF